MLTWHRWEEAATVSAGIVLALTPFLFGVAWHPLADTVAIGGGLVLVLVGVWDIVHPWDKVGELLEGSVGILLLASPWVLGAAGLPHIALSAWVIGLCTVLLTLILVQSQSAGQSATQQSQER